MKQTEPAAFPDLRKAIGALQAGHAKTVRAGHVDLGKGLWLSCDPKGQTEMACRPAGESFQISITGGDSGWWTCLGMGLPIERLARGRYVGVLLDAASEGLVSFTPSLRYYFQEGGQKDMGVAQPVLFTAGRQSELAYIPLDAARCELNIFFHTDKVTLTVFGLEPLLLS